MRARLPGRSIAHQSLRAFSSSNRISNWPPERALAPRNRAGMTRELFNTSTSPGAKKFQQIAKFPVFDPSAGAMQNQQPRFVAPGRGMLRDQFRRQGKIKISGSHREFKS